MNAHDSERIAGLLETDGLEPTTVEDEASVVVINTCCIREHADEKLYGTLGTLKKWKDADPERQIVVAGCLAQKDKDIVRERAPFVDVVLGTHNVHRAAELLAHSRKVGPITEIFDEAVIDDYALFPSALPVKRQTSFNAWVTIQIGCDNTCSYCIVPAVRGKEISRPFQEIVSEVKLLAESGVTEVTLLGQNVNSYGRDLSLAQRQSGDNDVKLRPQFAQLLRDVGAVEGIRRVRFVSPHPKDMRLDVFQAMGETASVCEHLHYPLQSGSDAVLALMHRGYTASRYLERMAEARTIVADLAVTSDLIVGFPGETEKDFQATLEVAAEAMFDAVFTYIFSPRPGTEAALMTDQFISHEVSVARFERLRVVTERTALAASRSRIGRVEEIIVEGMSRKNPDRTTGRTRQNKLVHFVSVEPLRMGTYATVEITDAGKHHLIGELREVGERPSHKIRVAVQAAN